jgi:hypothetical protein
LADAVWLNHNQRSLSFNRVSVMFPCRLLPGCRVGFGLPTILPAPEAAAGRGRAGNFLKCQFIHLYVSESKYFSKIK